MTCVIRLRVAVALGVLSFVRDGVNSDGDNDLVRVIVTDSVMVMVWVRVNVRMPPPL